MKTVSEHQFKDLHDFIYFRLVTAKGSKGDIIFTLQL